ncbi:MAG TPA: hypothetical protein VGS21_10770, partial [Acidimicrobiales bacterium]|nr:hypothetical protein [Acidimicrobiales bacterium]
LPFFVASPGAFVHQAVVLQLTRSTPSSEPVLSRLASLTGLDAFAGTRAAPISADVAVGACFAFVLVAGLLLVGPRRTSFEWFALGSTAVVTLGLLVPGEFFYHYAAFLAPFLGITVAIAVDRLCLSASGTTATGTPRNVGAHSPRRPPQVTGIGPRIVTGVAVLAAIVLCVHQFGNEQKEAYPDYGPLVATLIPSGACVVSDNAAVTLTTDRFVAASSACQPPADASGTSLSLDKGRNLLTPGSASPALIALWMGALRHADFVILDGNVKRLMPLDGQVKQYLDANFDFRATGGGLQIYQRD